MKTRQLAKLMTTIAVPAALAIAPYLMPRWRHDLRAPRELASPDDRFVEIDGFTMRYQVKGEGPPLILIHGFASSVVTWYRNIADLARDHRVYAVDLKGWGLSDKPSDGDYSLLAQARHLRAFMSAMSIKRAVLVGHSMGGTVAVHTAVAHPESVRGIVLVDPAGARRFPYLWLMSRAMDLPPLRQWMRLGMEYALANEALLTYNMPRAYYDPANLTPAMKRALLEPFYTHGFVEALINLTRDTRTSRLNGRTQQVQCPALLIWGEHDPVVPTSDAAYFLEHIRGARLVILSEAGHLPHEERAGDVNRLIREFVAELEEPETDK